MMAPGERRSGSSALDRSPTGVRGLDEVLNGGLPSGRTTLLAGGPGCGKSLLAIEILVRGFEEHGEPGVLLSFEETEQELREDAFSIGFDLAAVEAAGGLAMDFIEVERDRIQQTGDFDLEALFIRLRSAIDAIGAKRVVLDTLEVLFAALDDTAVLRAELRRLFRWLKEQGVVAIITAERGEGKLTRHGLEEYVSDCVIVLDHRVTDQLATRRLRIVKFRGTVHGTGEFPFLIDDAGFSVLPITSLDLDHPASDETVPTGVADLDAMLGLGGFYRGSTVMVSGTAGTGKSTLAAGFAAAACDRGECTLLLAFEESPSQIVRNMRSVGIDLTRHLDEGTLRINAGRPSQVGLESHLLRLNKLVDEFEPRNVVIDPITDFDGQGTTLDVKAMLMRMVDLLKRRNITALFTSITPGSGFEDPTVSSLIDTWIQLRNVELRGERNRSLHVVKARGMSHSNQVRELLIDGSGMHLLDVALGPDGVLVGRDRPKGDDR
jgi:circadian clock protein KaiC